MITKRYPRPSETVHARAPRFQIVRNPPHRFHPSPSRTRRRASPIIRSRRVRKNPKKKIVEAQSIASRTHLRLAKQPAGGPTENRARGVRVELGRRPRRRRGGGRSLFLGADDEGGAAAGGGRPAGRPPRGHDAHLGRGRGEAKHFVRWMLRDVPIGESAIRVSDRIVRVSEKLHVYV